MKSRVYNDVIVADLVGNIVRDDNLSRIQYATASSTTPQSPHPVVCAADRQASRQCRIGNFSSLALRSDRPSGADLAVSGEHSCAGSSGKSLDHAGECANTEPDQVSPGETTFIASTPKSRWQRIRPPASPVVAGRGVACTSVKIDKSPSPMAPKLSKRSLDSPLEGNGFEPFVPRRARTADSATLV
jgi:hypothetical protein